MAAPALDHVGAGALVGADHVPHVLGVELPRQKSRADQVDEQHRQLAALGLALDSPRHRFQRGDGVEQLAPVADAVDAEIAQVIGRQGGQQLDIDGILGERRGIALEPQRGQPSGYVLHDPILTCVLQPGS